MRRIPAASNVSITSKSAAASRRRAHHPRRAGPCARAGRARAGTGRTTVGPPRDSTCRRSSRSPSSARSMSSTSRSTCAGSTSPRTRQHPWLYTRAAHPCGREVAAADLGYAGTGELVGGHRRSRPGSVRPIGRREGVEPHLDETLFEIDIAMPAVHLREHLDRAHRLAPLEQFGCLPQGARRIGHISVAKTHHATGAFIARDRQQKIHFS